MSNWESMHIGSSSNPSSVANGLRHNGDMRTSMLVTAGTNRSFSTGVEMFNELEAAKLPTSSEYPKYKNAWSVLRIRIKDLPRVTHDTIELIQTINQFKANGDFKGLNRFLSQVMAHLTLDQMADCTCEADEVARYLAVWPHLHDRYCELLRCRIIALLRIWGDE